MEHQKILKLLIEASDSKFATRKWNIFNEQSGQSCPQRIFWPYKEGEKDALEYFRHVTKIFPNRGHIFQNKAWST